jgi:prevent-host-death family protein
MKSVGLRELKNRLSQYIRAVRSGECVLVTDRGEVVAEILPPGQATNQLGASARLQELARAGLVTLGAPNDPSLYPVLPPVLKGITSKHLLDEDRGPR